MAGEIAPAVSAFGTKGKELLMGWGAPLLGAVGGFFIGPMIFTPVMQYVADYIWSMGVRGAGDWAQWSGEISFAIFFLILLGISAALWRMSGGNWLMRGVAGFFIGSTVRVGVGMAQSIMIPGPGPAPGQVAY